MRERDRFLEEQAIANGVPDMEAFGRLAAQSDAPSDLGQTCTVFVADVAAEALSDGCSRADIFAGLQYSVVRNFRSRVMGQRRLLRRVFFQGKPATDPGLARTLAAVLEREVYVPADPGSMGAVGVALLTVSDDGRLAEAAAIDVERVLEARVTGRRSFQCKDRDCRNLCRLELAEVDVAGDREKVLSGGQCPKYDDVAAPAAKLPKDAPSPYQEREELLGKLIGAARGRGVGASAPRLGLPYAHYMVDALPFFSTFFGELGYAVEVLRPGPDTLVEGDRRCTAPGACAPVKLLHGLAGADVDVLVAPVFVHMPLPNAGAVTYTCPMTQGAPDMVARALAAEASATRVFRPVFFERESEGFDAPSFSRALQSVATALAAGPNGSGVSHGPSRIAFRAAYDAALARQRRYEEGLRGIGVHALTWARTHGYPVVLIAGETHVIHDAVLDAGIHELVAANGGLPLPVDCYPVPASVSGIERVHWASAGPTLRAAAAGVQEGDVFPLLLGAFGCGPNSMIEHLFADVVADWPHVVLESDGHGSRAGYVTRIQAFMHSIRGWRETAATARPRVEPPGAPSGAIAGPPCGGAGRDRRGPAGAPRAPRPAPPAQSRRRAPTIATTSVTWAVVWAAILPRRCAVRGSTQATWASRTPPPCARQGRLAPARSASPTSSSGARSSASWPRRRTTLGAGVPSC